MAECEEKMITQYAGDWYCVIDIGQNALDSQGLGEYAQGATMPVKFYFELKDDKTASLSLISDSFEEDFDTYMDVVIDATVKQLADENGVSEGIIKSVLEEQLDMSFKDYIKSFINFDSMMEQLKDVKDEYTYDLVDGKLVFTDDNGGTMEAEINEEGNILIDDLADDTKTQFKELGVEMPLVFVKEK